MTSQDARTVLVTGGAGYIGSHACRALHRAGYLPVTYDDLSTGHDWAVKWGPLEQGDLLDEQRLRAAIAKHRPAAILHFGGVISVGESVSEPERYYRVNLAGTLSLLRAAREAGISRIVFSSTAAIYGTPANVPIAETAPIVPINPYGASKAFVERVLADCAAAGQIAYAALRYFNAAGAAWREGIGEAHDPETHLIPNAIRAALGLAPSLSIFGTDYPTPDGTCIRDYIHVEDLAEAHVAALRHLEAGRNSLAVNLGLGRGYSVREVIAEVERASGRRVPFTLAPRRDGDSVALVADPSRARRELGFAPAYALAEIVDSAWRWHESQPEASSRRISVSP